MAKKKTKKAKKKQTKAQNKSRMTARERAMRRQQIIFGVIGVLIILSFVVTLIR